MRLCGVFHNWDLMSPSNFQNLIELSWLSVEMHYNDRLRPFSDCGFNKSWVDVESIQFGLDWHQSSATLGGGQPSGDKCMRRDNYFITLFYAYCT